MIEENDESAQLETTPTLISQAGTPQRTAALISGLGLLVMAILAPIAVFGVLGSLVVSGDPAATFDNIAGSQGLFRSGIAILLLVIMLDVVVAWALFVLLRSVNPTVSLLTAWLRLAFAAIFGAALVNLLEAAELVSSAGQSPLSTDQLNAQVMSLISSFDVGWTGIALAIFGLHLFGLGYLLFKSMDFPRFLGILVVVAGGGYVLDSLGVILIADFDPTIATFTFVGEVLLIFWLGGRALRGFPSDQDRPANGTPSSTK